MSNKTLLMLTIVVIIGMGIILALNVMPVFFETESAKYIRLGDVQGVAVSHQGVLYTLNFKQQEELISSLNHAHLIEKPAAWKRDLALPIDRIVIYLFGQKQMVVTPVSVEDEGWIFSFPDVLKGKGQYLKENTSGGLNRMLLSTFDP